MQLLTLKLSTLAWIGLTSVQAATITLGSVNDSNCLPFACNDSGSATGQSIEYQQVFAATQFGLTPITIQGVTFFDTFFPMFGLDNVPLIGANYAFSFAYTSNYVGGLSNDLASNISSGQRSFALMSTSGVTAGFPSLYIAGSRFYFDPAQGNLLLDVVVSNQDLVSSSSYWLANGFDSDSTGVVTSRAFLIGNQPGVSDSVGLIVQFNLADSTGPLGSVPEPKTAELLAAGIVVLLVAFRQTGRKRSTALACIVASSVMKASPVIPRATTIAIPSHRRAAQTSTPTFQASFSESPLPTFIRRNVRGLTQTFVGEEPVFNFSSTISVPIIPVIVVLSDGTTFDPTQRLNTAPQGSGLSALFSTITSPIFQAASYSAGVISLGTHLQFGDALMRATFWDAVSTVAPNWHTNISYVRQPPVTLNVPVANGGASGPIALVDNSWLVSQLDNIAGDYGGSLTFPLFLVYNVVQTDPVKGCCILGYHTVLEPEFNPNVFQTYGMGAYLDAGLTGNGASDVSVLANVVAEWLNDPYVNNFVPQFPAPYSFDPPGPPYSRECQDLLETGQPLIDRSDLAALVFHVSLFGRVYTLPNEVLAPWFLGVSPSTAVGGRYTFLGPVDAEFAGPAPTCHPVLP